VTSTVWAVFAASMLLEVWGQTAFKLGLDRLPDAPGAAFWRALLTNGWVLGGLAGYTVETGCWLFVLAHAPLSVAGPMAALAYVGVVVSGVLFLGERAGPRRWAGAGLVTFGAALVGSSL